MTPQLVAFLLVLGFLVGYAACLLVGQYINRSLQPERDARGYRHGLRWDTRRGRWGR